MKKTLLITAAIIGIIYTSTAGTGAAPAPESKVIQKQWLFKPLAANDVSMEVERLEGNVLVHLFSKNMKGVETIYVEKSKNPTEGFTRCKAVKVSENLIKSKNYISVVDNAPFDSNTDCYYRISTVTASGVTKVYPPINLSPVFTIEPDAMVENNK